MTLNEWKDKENLSFSELEKISGISSSKLKRIANDGICIKLEDANRIVKMTKSAVGYSDMLTGDC